MMAWLFPLAMVAILGLGCGTSNRETAPGGDPPLSRPDVELPEELAALADGLDSQVPADRAYAASQLGVLGAEARPAAPLLVDCLRDPDWQVRQRAAEALGALGDPQAVDPLIATLSDRDGDWSVRAAAARSLGRLGDPRAVEVLVAVRNDMNAHVRHMAVAALGQIGTPETIQALTAAADADSDAATRFTAAAALREIRQNENDASGSDSP